MKEVTAEKAVSFVREKVFSDGVSVPCKKWSFMNQYITYMHGTGDARGFQQWKEADRQVKKGSRAIYILVPMLYKPKAQEEGIEEKEVHGFKAMPVFRVEDTEGKELDYVKKLREFDPASLPLIGVASALGVKVSAGLTGDAGGWFNPNDNSITMGSNNGQVFLHELSHAVDNVIPGKSNDRAFGEVVADLSAAFLCKLYGYECNLDNANAYIRGWAGAAKGAFTFVRAMERVEKIYRHIEQVRPQAIAPENGTQKTMEGKEMKKEIIEKKDQIFGDFINRKPGSSYLQTIENLRGIGLSQFQIKQSIEKARMEAGYFPKPEKPKQQKSRGLR